MTLERRKKNRIFIPHTSRRVRKQPTAKNAGLEDASALVLPFTSVQQLVKKAKAEGKRIVTSNGTFDILHIGHVRNLAHAKTYGDMLVVGINSDSSARRNKGLGRPINADLERAEIIAALESVDAVFIYDDLTPIRWLKVLRPHVHVKGADRSKRQIVEREVVESFGGKIVRIPYLKNRSTTGVIAKILRKAL